MSFALSYFCFLLETGKSKNYSEITETSNPVSRLAFFCAIIEILAISLIIISSIVLSNLSIYQANKILFISIISVSSSCLLFTTVIPLLLPISILIKKISSLVKNILIQMFKEIRQKNHSMLASIKISA